MKLIQKRMLKNKETSNSDFLTIHVNLSTAYKFTKYCCICDKSLTTKNLIESHHIR